MVDHSHNGSAMSDPDITSVLILVTHTTNGVWRGHAKQQDTS